MAITLEATSELTLTGTNTTHSLTLPSGIDAGDLILVVVSTQESTDAGAPSTPTGYTQRWSLGHASSFKPRITAVYKIADGTEDGASLSFTWGSSVETHGVAMVFGGVDPGTPFDTTQTGPTSGASNPDPASITTVTNGAWVLGIVAANRTPTPSATISSGYTLVFSQTPDNRAFVIERKEKATAGADDPAAYIWGTLDNSTAVTDALRPFNGGAAALAASAALTASGTPTLYESADLAATAALTAAGTVALLGGADLTGVADLAGAGALTTGAGLAASATLAGGTGRARDRGVVFVAQGEQALLNGSWSTATASTARLFTTDPTAALSEAERNALTEADFPEASFTGYAAASLTGGGWTVTPGTPTVATHTDVAFATSADLGSPVSVWGYYVTRNTDGALIYYEVFIDAPVALSDDGDQVTFAPEFTL